MIYAPIRWFYSVLRALQRWHYANRPPPKVTVPGADPLSEAAGEHNTHFVSRHDIAECGLTCPACKNTAAQRGDFSGVCLDQRDNEVIQCGSCGAWLVASPDTEHGDHLLEYDHKLFHRFVRKPIAEVWRDKYGEDIQQSDQAAASANRMRLGADALSRIAREEARQTDPSRRDTLIKE